MIRLRYWLDNILEYFLYSLLIIMVLFSIWQVASRYIFNSPSIVSEEFLRFSLIWLSIIAAAYVSGKSKHVSFSLFFDSLSLEGQRKLSIALQVVMILFAAVIMVYGGTQAIYTALSQLSPVLSIPMGYVYSVLPLSGVLFCIYGVLNIYDLHSLKGHYSHAKVENIDKTPSSQGRGK